MKSICLAYGYEVMNVGPLCERKTNEPLELLRFSLCNNL